MTFQAAEKIDNKKKVLVIGAGLCGLGALKCCLEEDCLSVVCVERTDDIGGLWNYQEQAVEGRSTVMRSTIINTSKEVSCYSDFPMPADFPNFCHNTKFMEYMRMYADKFNLLHHIRLNTEIVKLYQDKTQMINTWQAVIRDLKTGVEETEQFDFVLVCSGHHADKKVVHFKGEEKFNGQIIHSHDYRDSRGFEEKRVVVVGIGNSGVDVAVDLTHAAKQVYLSTRRGSWIINRVWKYGLPLDFSASRFANYYMAKILPKSWLNRKIENILQSRFDHEMYGLKPAHRYTEGSPTVNDDLPNRIMSGAVIVKPDIERLTESGVIFKDGSKVENVQAIITATGYIFGFPFIDHPGFEVIENDVNLYKYMFSPDIDHPESLAVIGCVQPIGSFSGVAELQCRWAIQIFKGRCSLPSREEMWREIEARRERLSRSYYKSARHTLQLIPVQYMTEISQLMGCRPNLLKLLVTDPKLAYHVLFGPYTPYQNRLVGPGAWPGAREAILTVMDRVREPLKTRKCSQQLSRNEKHIWMKFIHVRVILIALAMYLGFSHLNIY